MLTSRLQGLHQCDILNSHRRSQIINVLSPAFIESDRILLRNPDLIFDLIKLRQNLFANFLIGGISIASLIGKTLFTIFSIVRAVFIIFLRMISISPQTTRQLWNGHRCHHDVLRLCAQAHIISQWHWSQNVIGQAVS